MSQKLEVTSEILQEDIGNYKVNLSNDLSTSGNRPYENAVTREEISIRSPAPNSPNSSGYNRLKYYTALRNEYQQLNPKAKQSFLKVPKHVLEPFLYVIQAPFQDPKKQTKQKQKSITTIFTCWNTMVGSGIVALPWTFGESGFVLGLIICIVGLIVSYRTCILMIRSAGNDEEYFDTLYKYWGKWAYYCGYISTLMIMIAAVTSYFINLSQMLYYIFLALIEWISGIHLDPVTKLNFSCFSLNYITLLVLAIELVITNKKDLSIFIRLMSYGSIFIISLILFIIGFGFYGLATTDFQIVGADHENKQTPILPGDEERYLKLFNYDFSPLAGALGIGYFLHTLSLPITRNNENQKNNERDLFCGYLLVGFTYISVGIMGSIGFSGVYFTSYYNKAETTEIAQNCMSMFENKDVIAFVMRLALFLLLFCCFPLINHFLRSLVLQLFFRDKEISKKIFLSVNIVILLIPAGITIFYPQIGSILGYIGSVAGLLIVYILPVITYLKKYKTELQHPLLAKAIENDLYDQRISGQISDKSPKLMIKRAEIDTSPGRSYKTNKPDMKSAMRRFYFECFTHSFIIIYGILILIFNFYNPFNQTKEK